MLDALQSERRPVRGPVGDTLPGWYFAARSSDVGSTTPHPVRIQGRDWVLYRTASGRVAALSGRCAHMGASLARGRVIDDCVRCPFHHWEYGTDGACVRVPGQAAPPPFARVEAPVVREQHGAVYVFVGGTPPFELPFFADEDPADFVTSAPFRLELDCPWYLASANAYDVAHLIFVHDRRPVRPAVIDYPHPYACRIVHTYQLGGAERRDRVLRAALGETVELSYTSWWGNLSFAVSSFGRVRNYMLFSVQPDGPTRCIADIAVLVRRDSVLGAGGLLAKRWLTKGFFAHEAETLAGVRFNPRTLIASDATVAEYMRWLGPVWQRPGA